MGHINRQAPEDQKLRIVVPNSRRTEVFKLAHSALTGGHFSQKRTRAVINRKFTWPTLRKDVINWCQTCPECQLAQNSGGSKVPLKPLPIITHPFRTVAFNIVSGF